MAKRKSKRTPINRGMKTPKRAKHTAAAGGSDYAAARLKAERKADPEHIPSRVLIGRRNRLDRLLKARGYY